MRRLCSILSGPLWAWLSSLLESCAHAHPPLPWSRRQSSAVEVGGLTQHAHRLVNYLANCLWPAPSPSLCCTDNGIILSFCWGNLSTVTGSLYFLGFAIVLPSILVFPEVHSSVAQMFIVEGSVLSIRK